MLKRSPVTLAVLLAPAFPAFSYAQENQTDSLASATVTELDSVVVTAPASKQPLTVRLNPKAPHQPLPAQDGAAFLKTIPGMNVIRKGGTDGDPMFRGMAGSRLGVLIDGHEVYGGCSSRMDPPTAYIHPESFDKVTLVKGPTVAYGSGFSAGVVNFKHDNQHLAQPGATAHASVTLGSAGRNDVELEGKTGTDKFFIHGSGTRADANDYKDGGDKTVHSSYTRWNTSLNMGWMPDQDTLVKLSVGKSDGKAAYADRSMDGEKFERENAELSFEKRNVSPLIDKLEGQVFHSYVDHVMDNYSLRQAPAPGMMMPAPFSIMNPDRTTNGAKLSATLHASDKTRLTLGVDAKTDIHRGRMNSAASAAQADAINAALPRVEDMRFEQKGIFAEANHFLTDSSRVKGGVRVDDYKARDSRSFLDMQKTVINNTKGETTRKTLKSGFVRYEKDIADDKGTYYAGVGHTERFPDYWELRNLDISTGNSVFLADKLEKTNQLDIGRTWKTGKWSGSASVFYNKTDNYQLVKSVPMGMMNRLYTRNIDAETYGFEADAAYQISDNWKGMVAASLVHGNNKTDDKPLAQQPAAEMKLGAEYDNKKQFLGAQLRLVSKQDRVDMNSGNIVGVDIGKTPGFGVFSINGGTRPKKGVLLSAGVDNLFNKTYAENISKGGYAVAGYGPATVRVNEPGRTVWVKATFDID